MEVDPPAGPQTQAAGLKAGEDAAPRATHIAVRRLFLRILAVVYLLAFGSLAVQMEGLVGSGGILPVGALLDWAGSRYGPERYWLLPTLCWLSSGDGLLRGLCWGGAFLSVLLFLELAPVLVLLLLWAFYLSLVTAGQIFLGYQWDGLLLEVGLLAMLIAPSGLRPRQAGAGRVPGHALWLLRWLLFRLMFSSGVVKLRSGDEAWRGLTALRFHYETQPLPTPLAWYAHQLPGWFHSLSTVVMFSAELLAPLLIFAPRRLRLGACAAMAGLQVLIAATGNYGFFNLLTLALCVLLLDDQALPSRWRGRGEAASPERTRLSWRGASSAALAAALFLLSAIVFSGTLGLRIPWPRPILQALDVADSFRSINGYGLFAVMTTSRPEIVVEGSADGLTWLPVRVQVEARRAGVGRPVSWPRTSRGWTGRCGSRPWARATGIRGSSASWAGCCKARRRCSACWPTTPSPGSRRARCGPCCTSTTSAIPGRAARTGLGGGANPWVCTAPFFH